MSEWLILTIYNDGERVSMTLRCPCGREQTIPILATRDAGVGCGCGETFPAVAMRVTTRKLIEAGLFGPLENAPPDDEPSSPEEDASCKEAATQPAPPRRRRKCGSSRGGDWSR